MPPVVIHLVAAQSETGKTTFLEQLLPVLKKRGLAGCRSKRQLTASRP
jgi:molybdopterin-guanine dinucleotide biosynthesis protein